MAGIVDTVEILRTGFNVRDKEKTIKSFIEVPLGGTSISFLVYLLYYYGLKKKFNRHFEYEQS